MADIAIITAITDGYDTLKPVMPQVGADVEWICVTDGDPLPDIEAASGWTLVCERRSGQHANLAAKLPKLRPWQYTTAPMSIWIDASFRIISPRFAVEAAAYADPIAQFPHPWRDCIYAEAAASEELPKYAGEPIAAQASHYWQQGHPEHWGLWAAGVIARCHTQQVMDFSTAWAREINTWSFQDQISQPYALRQCGLRPTALPGTHFANDWVTYEGSSRHEH